MPKSHSAFHLCFKGVRAAQARVVEMGEGGEEKGSD